MITLLTNVSGRKKMTFYFLLFIQVISYNGWVQYTVQRAITEHIHWWMSNWTWNCRQHVSTSRGCHCLQRWSRSSFMGGIHTEENVWDWSKCCSNSFNFFSTIATRCSVNRVLTLHLLGRNFVVDKCSCILWVNLHSYTMLVQIKKNCKNYTPSGKQKKNIVKKYHKSAHACPMF